MSVRTVALALSWVAAGAFVVASCALLVLARRLSLQKRLVYLLFPTNQLAMALFALWGEEHYGLPDTAVVATGAIALASAAYDVWLFRHIAVAERDSEAAYTARLLAEQLDAQAKHAELLQADAARADAMREQIRETLTAAAACLDSGDERATRELLDSAADTLRKPGGHYCAHPVLDALLAAKARRCQDEGVTLHAQADVPADIALPDVDLCAVFANLLDNAINAASHAARKPSAVDPTTPDRGAFVELDAHITIGCLVVRVENSFCEQNACKDGRPATQLATGQVPANQNPRKHPRTSHHLSEHGWGTSIVESVAARHAGSVKASQAAGIYQVEVVLPFA